MPAVVDSATSAGRSASVGWGRARRVAVIAQHADDLAQVAQRQSSARAATLDMAGFAIVRCDADYAMMGEWTPKAGFDTIARRFR